MKNGMVNLNGNRTGMDLTKLFEETAVLWTGNRNLLLAHVYNIHVHVHVYVARVDNTRTTHL